jgi:hypothetical protein
VEYPEVWAFFDNDLFMAAGKVLFLFNVAHVVM